MVGLYVAAGLGIVALGISTYGIVLFNGFVKSKNQTENAWSQIDVQLKRRHDLIPSLVETAKGYMQHEKETLTQVTEARNLARQASSVKDAKQAETRLSSALGQFFMTVENYPDLKADQHFLNLHEELTSTENKITFARQFYNDCVMNYNNLCQSIPNNIIAAIGHFTPQDFFEIEDVTERKAPEVSFS